MPGRGGVLRLLLIHSFILFSFVPTIHYNLLAPIARLDERWAGPLVPLGRAIGLGTVWRMFSPTAKVVFWVDWYAQFSDQGVVLLETPNLSPRDRRRRGWWTARAWDVKQPYVQYSITFDHAFRSAYARWLCEQARLQTGRRPVRIVAVKQEIPIPAPHQAAGWSPVNAAASREVPYEPAFVCP